MLRRILTLLVVLLMLPVISLSEDLPAYEVFTFAGRLPDKLAAPLAAMIADDSWVLSGAAIQHNGYHYGSSPSDMDSYTAMVLADTPQGLRLYAAALVENLPWQINDYSHFLRQMNTPSVSIYMPQASRIPVFSVDYPSQGSLVSDLFCFWANQLWCMDGHIDKVHSVTIDNELNALTVTDTQSREKFWCDVPFFLDYMADISAFPASRAACQALSHASVYGVPAAGSIVYAAGAHLRTDPTGSSGSLGTYEHNVPMLFTGEQKAGVNWPWYQVRIGNTMGWMSSNYVHHQPDYGFGPRLLGRTLAGCSLYAGAGDQHAAASLAPGTTFHILTEYQGMYHVCIPREDISWAVDPEGVYGYIPQSGVLTGYSPSSLLAQENAR